MGILSEIGIWRRKDSGKMNLVITDIIKECLCQLVFVSPESNADTSLKEGDPSIPEKKPKEEDYLIFNNGYTPGERME